LSYSSNQIVAFCLVGFDYNISMETTVASHFAVLVAAHNEADRIYDTVAAAALVPGVVGVLVADDGSKDATVKEAVRAGAVVISNRRNLGKGSAMELAAATLEKTEPFGALDGVLLLDGDLGGSASAAVELLKPLLARSADLVIGILPTPTKKAGFGLAQSLARQGILKYGNEYEAKAPLSGQRALTLDCLERIRPFARGYGMEVAMTIGALQQEQRIIEVPVDMQHRTTGRNLKGFLHRGKQYYQIHQLLAIYNRQTKS